jgi:VanZ family protein
MALLAIGTARAYRRQHGLGANLALGALFTIAFGMSDEFHQRFTPGRSPDLLDVLADTIGACAAAALVYAWHRLRPAAH